MADIRLMRASFVTSNHLSDFSCAVVSYHTRNGLSLKAFHVRFSQ